MTTYYISLFALIYRYMFYGPALWAAHIVHFMNIKIQILLVITFHKCQLGQIISGATEIPNIVNGVAYVCNDSRLQLTLRMCVCVFDNFSVLFSNFYLCILKYSFLPHSYCFSAFYGLKAFEISYLSLVVLTLLESTIYDLHIVSLFFLYISSLWYSRLLHSTSK